ncbi:hypothetical protein C8A05DRAFT_12200 [Staphylotrichum tortipilum]|uniref:Uncharacterized protein n=1 Tax=Staphylotrichum tortipilum TaxID=2831512 RepID=A0AAN6MTB3_9PEZI|nr:hypothetical protein C8A05DRAFT_12200 [Staphylotrichum longicolle]
MCYLTLLVPAYAFAQSFVGGDLSAQAPYGLPAQDFAFAATTPTSNNTFPITGYNTSLPAGANDATETDVGGWSLNIRVLANVPLANSSSPAINKALYMDATAMTITPPAGVGGFNSSSWRVCAIVFTGGLRAGGATHADGSCTGVLAEDCINQLQANSLANKAGRTGGCRDLDVPTNCGVHFNGLTGTGYGEFASVVDLLPPSQEITPIGNGSLTDRGSMFFASGFEPAHRGNISALAAAERRVWPVLMTWTHFDEAGAVADSAGWLSCAKTNDSKEVAETASFAPVSRVLVGLERMGWMVLLWVSIMFS